MCCLLSVWQQQAVDLIFTNLLPLSTTAAPHRPLHPIQPILALMCNWQQQLAPGGNQRQLPNRSRSSSGRHIAKLEIPEKQGDSKSHTLIVCGLSRPDGRVLLGRSMESPSWSIVWKTEINCKLTVMKVDFGDNYDWAKQSCVVTASKATWDTMFIPVKLKSSNYCFIFFLTKSIVYQITKIIPNIHFHTTK